MGYVNLIIESDAKISVRDKQLLLQTMEKEETFALEDLNSVLIENLRSNLSVYALSQFAANGIIVYFCDEKHTPNGYLLPFNNYYNQLKMYQIQTSIKMPFQKQLWKSIVQTKIKNQYTCLKFIGKESNLDSLIEKVQSNDHTNIEAVAASLYFKTFFEGMFTRKADINMNAALNYGYAILRGIIARSIVSHGLLPFIGLKHANQYNNYNLADDLIEVFRPFVDYCVYQNRDLLFGKEFKHLLCQLPNCDCMMNGKIQTIAYAIELYVQAFIKALTEQKNILHFPELIPLKIHDYE